jgi:hypothetical protein
LPRRGSYSSGHTSDLLFQNPNLNGLSTLVNLVLIGYQYPCQQIDAGG